MKILTGTQIRELDKYTIEHEPIKSIDLMERAAKALTRAITRVWDDNTSVVVFAGPGNNGGDALAWSVEPKDARAKETLSRARRILAENEYSNFLTAPTASAQYVREDGLTASERELAALLRWARRNNKASTAKRAGERGYPELQEALRTVKALFKEFND